MAAHGPAMAADEQDDCSLGGLIGVLPDPGALGIAGAECACHGVPQGRGVERPAGLQDRQEGSGGGEQRVLGGKPGAWGGRNGRKRLWNRDARGWVRRRVGVEHGSLPPGIV